ncbi:MAG: hypothetical protein U9Q37_07885, partial [Euryarchaeota archaeon]|nr:hypothetical protein [Euryarchaeota archaeon]
MIIVIIDDCFKPHHTITTIFVAIQDCSASAIEEIPKIVLHSITRKLNSAKNFIEYPGITWSKVSYDEYISVRIEMLSKKGFDGLRIFVVVKFIRNWAT